MSVVHVVIRRCPGGSGGRRQWHGRHTLRSARQRFPSRVLGLDRKVGPGTNDAGNLRTGVPCSGSAAVRSRVTAADSLGGPIWTGHSRSPPPLLRRRPPGWLGAPYGARASLPFGATLRWSPAGAGKGCSAPFDPPEACAAAEFAVGARAPSPVAARPDGRPPHHHRRRPSSPTGGAKAAAASV